MTISAEDVRRLLEADEPDATLVLSEGRVAVVPAADLESDRYAGALPIVSRADLLARDDLLADDAGRELSEHELAEVAAKLDAGVSNLGG
jgi:hypothetical protein